MLPGHATRRARRRESGNDHWVPVGDADASGDPGAGVSNGGGVVRRLPHPLPPSTMDDFDSLWQRGRSGGAVAVVAVPGDSGYRMVGQLVCLPDDNSHAPRADGAVALLVIHEAGDKYFATDVRVGDAMRSLESHTWRYVFSAPDWRRLPVGWRIEDGILRCDSSRLKSGARPTGTPPPEPIEIPWPCGWLPEPGTDPDGLWREIFGDHPPDAEATPTHTGSPLHTVPAEPAAGAEQAPPISVQVWLEECAWTVSEASRRTRFSATSLARWRCAEGEEVPGYVAAMMSAVRRMGPERVERWGQRRLTPRAMRDWVWGQGGQRRAAEVLGVSQSQVSRWADGSRPVPVYISRLVDLLDGPGG